ncbi:MAG: 2-phospho-L-lactate transferase [Dehalococcoidia bacterium]|nr:2-phospho-L-lactate transferase [Dehalococcoidia bacterium]
MITVLAGGVGAARFLAGLAQRVSPREVTAICNVGDDFEWHGLHVSPDIDTVIYTLAGIEGELGWGLRDDTRVTLAALAGLGAEAWFGIGDRDLATHLLRTERLGAGVPLSAVTAELARAHGIEVRLLPVTDDPHPTMVLTGEGELPFQEYFVRRRAQDAVRGFRFPGALDARHAPGVIEALREAEVVVIAPSNPFVSIDPMLQVPGVRAALEQTRARRVAVSPIVGGQAIKGPAAAMLGALGHEVSALGVARLYRGLIDTFVLDTVDATLVPDVEALGMRAVAIDTMMQGDDGRRRVAAGVLEALDVSPS